MTKKDGGLSRTEQRLVDRAADIAQQERTTQTPWYLHSIFAQTCMPRRDPGDSVREYEHTQGNATLRIDAGVVIQKDQKFRKLGLPWGPKPRLILAYLNSLAILTGSPEIEIEASLSAFVRRLELSQDGRSIRTVKDQLSRLAAATITLAFVGEDRARQVQGKIVKGFDIWMPKDGRQRVLWPSTVCLSADYFSSLAKHAVPLDERALAALSHNAMALDIYAWLAQRLWRITDPNPYPLPWGGLRDQFGVGYARLDNFKSVFNRTLDMVLAVYPAARVTPSNGYLWLYESPPPIAKDGRASRPRLRISA